MLNGNTPNKISICHIFYTPYGQHLEFQLKAFVQCIHDDVFFDKSENKKLLNVRILKGSN